jgi:hypothetical protein
MAGSAFGGFHLASLPFVRNRLNRVVIGGLATLKRLGVRGTPWKDIGRGAVDEWPANKT